MNNLTLKPKTYSFRDPMFESFGNGSNEVSNSLEKIQIKSIKESNIKNIQVPNQNKFEEL